MLDNYNHNKETLLNIYNNLYNSENEFIVEKLKKELAEKKDSLGKDQFILAIAGQMKAGKSTLLNALIFGDDVLPADDTELTAKLTFITYAEETSYEATLYTSDEFRSLRQSLKGTENEKEFTYVLNKSLEKLQEKGISDYEEILSKEYIKGVDIKDLIEFVGKKGIYTPFVNTLTLKTNSPWVKNLIVVDTPGMNSPNKLRDKVVKEWITRADAVLYCSYAGRAMDATDLNFIKDYMLHIPQKYRIFALTKSDTINGEDKLISAINNMIDSDQNKELQLIPSKEDVFPVSQMAVLLSKMDEEDKITPIMLEELERLEELSFDFENSKMQFSKMEKAIEKKLIENKSSNIIEAHCQFLEKLFEREIFSIKEEIDSAEKSLIIATSNTNELKLRKAQIRIDRNNVKANFENLMRQTSNSLSELYQKTIKIEREYHSISKQIELKGESLELSKSDFQLQKIIHDAFEKSIDTILAQCTEYSNSFPKSLSKILDNSDINFEYLNTEHIKDKIQFLLNSFIDGKLTNLKRNLEQLAIEIKSNYSENVANWKKFKNIFTAKSKIESRDGKEVLIKFISEVLIPYKVKFEDLDTDLRSLNKEATDQVFKEMEEKLNEALDSKKIEIRNLENIEGAELQRLQEKLSNDLKLLNLKKENLSILESDISNQLNNIA